MIDSATFPRSLAPTRTRVVGRFLCWPCFVRNLPTEATPNRLQQKPLVPPPKFRAPGGGADLAQGGPQLAQLRPAQAALQVPWGEVCTAKRREPWLSRGAVGFWLRFFFKACLEMDTIQTGTTVYLVLKGTLANHSETVRGVGLFEGLAMFYPWEPYQKSTGMR